MRSNDEDLRMMSANHFACIGIYRDIPFFCKKIPPFFVDITACGKHAVIIGSDSPGMSTGLFPEGIVFKDTRNTAKADNSGRDFFHLAPIFLIFPLRKNPLHL
jgi:hypothetical protein